jgi:type VI secretion system protein ImpH
VTQVQKISDALGQLNFFDLLRQLERRTPDKPRISDTGAHDEDIAVLGQAPFVEYSTGNVDFFGVDATGRYHVHSRFLGMLGPHGALPLSTTYEAKHWMEMRDESFARFLDIFNNRFQQLFFRAWSDARPASQHDRPKQDRFAAYIGSSVGMATHAFRNRDSVSDLAKLAVAGLLAPAVKSASRIRSLLSHMFKADVEIEQFVGEWLLLERQDQSALGAANARLGDEAMLGSSVYSLQDKFRIRIKAKSLTEFQDFLPGGKHCNTLADAVAFYLGELLSYEVELGLAEHHTQATKLGSFGRLGWTSWMKPRDRTFIGIFRWDCRFHPAERRTSSTGSRKH